MNIKYFTVYKALYVLGNVLYNINIPSTCNVSQAAGALFTQASSILQRSSNKISKLKDYSDCIDGSIGEN